ncbi:hypothetical protein FOA43_004510 [Brettanomyces nanus]|uniref:Vacuolar protein sorting-associated protein 28 n=1 Tax=Eeniella nana TaxID=13502 RepID=A0A875RXZ2_EENNA|nr:uncharacterized protein FOA43_004510 [Brettanomyces nanus]QPG77107.1 hypothetical protein FOA43_004510 [Brettanomyces nanus]
MSTPYTPRNTSAVSIALIQQAKRSLDLEIPLFETHNEREKGESIAELYSIIVGVNELEKSYTKDEFVDNEEYYTNTMVRLIKQFYLILENDEVKQEYGDLQTFAKRFNLNCPLAVKRIQTRIPATIERRARGDGSDTESATGSSTGSNTGSATGSGTARPAGNANVESPVATAATGRAIAEATGALITLMDAIKLDYNTKEQLHPLLTDIVTATNNLFQEYDGRAKLVQWLIKLNNMRFDETLSHDELKEFLWDVDGAYKGFFAKLG